MEEHQYRNGPVVGSTHGPWGVQKPRSVTLEELGLKQQQWSHIHLLNYCWSLVPWQRGTQIYDIWSHINEYGIVSVCLFPLSVCRLLKGRNCSFSLSLIPLSTANACIWHRQGIIRLLAFLVYFKELS